MEFFGNRRSMASKSDAEKRNTISERNNSMMKNVALIDDIDMKYIKDNQSHSFSIHNPLNSVRESESRSSYLHVIFPS